MHAVDQVPGHGPEILRRAGELGREMSKGELESLMSEMGASTSSGSAREVTYQGFATWWEVNKNKQSAGTLFGLKAKAIQTKQERAPTRRNWSRRWFVIDGFNLVYRSPLRGHAIRPCNWRSIIYG
jgi:hypothetical protein